MINFSIIKKITLFRHNKKNVTREKSPKMLSNVIQMNSKMLEMYSVWNFWFDLIHTCIVECVRRDGENDRQTEIIVISIRHQKFVFIMCGVCASTIYSSMVWQMLLLIWTYLPIFWPTCVETHWNHQKATDGGFERWWEASNSICACVRACMRWETERW